MKATLNFQLVITDESVKGKTSIAEAEDIDNDILMKILRKMDVAKNQVEGVVRPNVNTPAEQPTERVSEQAAEQD